MPKIGQALAFSETRGPGRFLLKKAKIHIKVCTKCAHFLCKKSPAKAIKSSSGLSLREIALLRRVFSKNSPYSYCTHF